MGLDFVLWLWLLVTWGLYVLCQAQMPFWGKKILSRYIAVLRYLLLRAVCDPRGGLPCLASPKPWTRRMDSRDCPCYIHFLPPGAGNGTQGLMLARLVFCHWAMSPACICFLFASIYSNQLSTLYHLTSEYFSMPWKCEDIFLSVHYTSEILFLKESLVMCGQGIKWLVN